MNVNFVSLEVEADHGALRHGHRHPDVRRLHGLRGRVQDREPGARGLQPRLDRLRDARHVPDAPPWRSARSGATTATTRRASSCCPTGASHVDPFGAIVLVTHGECIGCKACMASCPYDARFVHPEGYVDKCTFCIHRVKEAKDPACVSVCPTHCMTFGDLDDPNSAISRLLASRAPPSGDARRPERSRGSST